MPDPSAPPVASRASTVNTANTAATGLVTSRAMKPTSAGRFCASAAVGHVPGLQGNSGRDVADEVDAVTVGQPGRGEEMPDLTGRHRGGLPALGTARHDPVRTKVGPGQRDQLVERLTRCTDEQQTERTDQAAEEKPDDQERQRRERAVGKKGVEGGLSLPAPEVLRGHRRPAYPSVRGFDVKDHRLGDDEGSVPGPRRPPAEVDVVAEQGQPPVEAAEVLEHVPADQHPRGVDREHLPLVVVLALVVLAALEPGFAPSRPADRHADLEQAPQRGPLAVFRAEDRRGRVLPGRGDERLQHVRRRGAVVVQQPDPIRLPVGVGGPDAV